MEQKVEKRKDTAIRNKENVIQKPLLNPLIQKSNYDMEDKAAPDNNIFWDEQSNPLSSKGN